MVSENGKNLENGQSSVYFKGYSKALESIPVESISATTEKLGQATAAASVGTLAATSLMGSSMSIFAKFFQILEMTVIVKLINFDFDPLFSTFLTFISNLTDLNLFSFFTQKIMDKNLLNSEAGPYRGKLTSDGKAPWLLMDFGYLGSLLILLQLVLLVLKLTKVQGKWAEKIRMFNIQLLQAFVVDFSGTIMSSLGSFGYKTMDVWMVFSVLIAIWLMVVFTQEFLRQYSLTEALYLRDKKTLTKMEKELRDMYLDGMDKTGVRESFFIRHYNLFFTLKFLVIILIIYSLQFLQAVQILGTLLLSLAWLVKSTIMFCKHKFFESKLVKYVRFSQEVGFTVVIIFTGLLYLDFLSAVDLGKGFKKVIVIAAISIVILNVALEVVLLVKGVFEVTCCKKKKKNKVEPFALAPQAEESKVEFSGEKSGGKIEVLENMSEKELGVIGIKIDPEDKESQLAPQKTKSLKIPQNSGDSDSFRDSKQDPKNTGPAMSPERLGDV